MSRNSFLIHHRSYSSTIFIIFLSWFSYLCSCTSVVTLAFDVQSDIPRTLFHNEVNTIPRCRVLSGEKSISASLQTCRRKMYPARKANCISRVTSLCNAASGMSAPNPPPFNVSSSSNTLTNTTSLLANGEKTNDAVTSTLDLTYDSSKVTVKNFDDIAKQKPSPSSSSSDGLFRLAPPLTFDKFLTMQVKDLFCIHIYSGNAIASYYWKGRIPVFCFKHFSLNILCCVCVPSISVLIQDKRVVVTICYSGESGLRPYFLSAAKRIKAAFPDVLIERRILPSASSNRNNFEGSEDAGIFEILVDGKEVIGKVRSNRNVKFGSSSKPPLNKKIVFVNMETLGVAISRARRRRRPNTSYLVAADSGEPAKLGVGINSSKRRVQNTNQNKSTAGKNNAASLRLDSMRRSKQEKVHLGPGSNRHYND
jgi:hypothetical protein